MGHLKGVVVCICGDLRSDKDKNKTIREQFTDENIKNWLKYRGGKLVEEVNKTTTHLLCSRSAFKNKDPMVQSARKRGCYIVTYEWLADTIQLHDYHDKKKAPPNLYHPRRARDGDAISNLYTGKKKRKTAKQAPVGALETAARDGDDETKAEKGIAETEIKHSTIPEETDPPNVSEALEKESKKVVDDKKKAGILANKASSKAAGKAAGKASTKPKNKEPPVDLSLYSVCKDEPGLHSIEVSKPGLRLILELFESKSEPKKFLFGARKYKTKDPGFCARCFPSSVPGSKKHEFKQFRLFFWQCTGVHWHQRNSVPSKGPFYYQSPALPEKTTISTGHKETSSQLGGTKKRQSMGFEAFSREHCDHKTSMKRKRCYSEELTPARALKGYLICVAFSGAFAFNRVVGETTTEPGGTTRDSTRTTSRFVMENIPSTMARSYVDGCMGSGESILMINEVHVELLGMAIARHQSATQ
ncbi:hypothetical protein J7T55_009100 [Diaporthe amygdali]|uniref:uncharacterized protein n=1 Tax=Phomopsis amygdali TaxID=1214568 RepID=UPI0022FDC4AC|nr:uncharacterized protein J7T55_009100 [Diaporthe amygdali]KAJ0118317.1 hypothetical protein J7T55_009100 [Diaporthe amygdali]